MAPLGLAFFSPYGAFVGATELILFSPLLFFAIRRPATTTSRHRLTRLAFIALWAVLVWLIGSTDPLRQTFISVVLRADTEYAGEFSEHRFAAIAPGMTTTDVARVAGVPLEQWWQYSADLSGDCRVVRFAQDVVVEWRDFDRCTPAGIKRGIIHGETDELGFHAVESPHYITDMHAAVLDRLGLDGRRLVVPGRKRLDIDHGNVIREICS